MKTEQRNEDVRILIVDDERDILRFLHKCLSREGFAVESTPHPMKAMELLARIHFDIVVTDIKMPEMDGLSFLKKVKESSPATEVIMMTGFATVETAVGSMKLGAFDYIAKPFNMDEILTIAKRAVERLNSSNDLIRFREIDELKDEFLCNVSHELKTPLTSIKAAADTLAGEWVEEPSPKQLAVFKRLIVIIRRNSDRMTHLVDDVMDAFRFENNKMSLNRVAAPLEKIIGECVEECLGPCQERGLTLQYDSQKNLPPISVDPFKLKQMILNLIGNAMKFTPQGGTILVSSRLCTAGLVEPELEIAVQDTGIGISREEQKNIFDKFYQVDGSSSRRSPGLGLGLALVKQIAQMHSGEVYIESEPGQGSTFLYPAALRSTVKTQNAPDAEARPKEFLSVASSVAA